MSLYDASAPNFLSDGEPIPLAAERKLLPPSRQTRTQQINRLQRKHPKTRRQRTYHGAGRYSVQFFDKATGKLVADYNL